MLMIKENRWIHLLFYPLLMRLTLSIARITVLLYMLTLYVYVDSSVGYLLSNPSFFIRLQRREMIWVLWALRLELLKLSYPNKLTAMISIHFFLFLCAKDVNGQFFFLVSVLIILSYLIMMLVSHFQVGAVKVYGRHEDTYTTSYNKL